MKAQPPTLAVRLMALPGLIVCTQISLLVNSAAVSNVVDVNSKLVGSWTAFAKKVAAWSAKTEP